MAQIKRMRKILMFIISVRVKMLVPSRITNLPNVGDLLWRLYIYNPGNKLMAKRQKKKVAFPSYTESVKFKSQSRDTASKRKPYRGLGTR